MSVDVTQGDEGIVVAVRGALDSEVARTVFDAVESALRAGAATDVEVDLRAMDEWTAGGLHELSECARFGIRFRMGPHAAPVE
jgi:hypothetical protein